MIETEAGPTGGEIWAAFKELLLKKGRLPEGDVFKMHWIRPRLDGERRLLLDYPSGTDHERISEILAQNYALWESLLPYTVKVDWGEQYELIPDLPEDTRETDTGNAARLVYWYGDILLYCYPWKKWLLWDGRRWKADDTGHMVRLAKDTARRIYAEASSHSDQKRREDLAKWAIRSEAKERIKGMIELARPEVAVLPDQLDADPWLLTVINGTLDLKTGELREHRPEDLITKLAPVHFDPDARLQLWDDFLRDATGDDQELIDFLQCATGYTLTGDVREEVLFFVHGPTVAGKTTFIEAVKATMGDYATTADFETFLARRSVGDVRPDIARLAGARFVASVEVAEGKRLAEGLIKLITGIDKVTTRFLYGREFEFVPSLKLWLAANHAPKIKDDDDATWRRILRVPFEHTVKEPDPQVKATLRDPEVAGPAILAWAVKGCLSWQRDGLKVPQRVTRATEDLRDEMDPLKEFFDDCCTFGSECWTSASQLWTAYENWAAESGERYLVRGKKWGDRLRAKGCEKKRRSVAGKQQKGWSGIGLLDQLDPNSTSSTNSEQFTESILCSTSRKEVSGNTGLSGATGTNSDALVGAVKDLGGGVVEVETPDGAVTLPF